MNKTVENENWFSRAKADADKGIPTNERITGIVLVIVSSLMIFYLSLHQIWSTGFFTTKFGMLEMFLLYGSLAAWIITGSLEGIFGQRLLSRLFDVFGGVIFITISLFWLLVIFPFEFAYFADVLPDFLRFILLWVSNDIGRGIMVVGVIVLFIAAAYSPIAYKFVSIKHSE